MKTRSRTSTPVPRHKLFNCQAGRLRGLLTAEFSPLVLTHPDLLQLALNEAEAVAGETAFPALFFPVLAEEKLISLAGWAQRQSALCNANQPTAWAA